MCVDDDDITLFLHERVIKEANFADKLMSFNNPLNALTFIENELNKCSTDALIPDLIFLDVNMPYMDAWGFLKELELLLTNNNRTLNVVIVSSSTNAEDLILAYSNKRVIKFIEKPLSLKVLKDLKRESCLVKSFE